MSIGVSGGKQHTLRFSILYTNASRPHMTSRTGFLPQKDNSGEKVTSWEVQFICQGRGKPRIRQQTLKTSSRNQTPHRTTGHKPWEERIPSCCPGPCNQHHETIQHHTVYPVPSTRTRPVPSKCTCFLISAGADTTWAQFPSQPCTPAQSLLGGVLRPNPGVALINVIHNHQLRLRVRVVPEEHERKAPPTPFEPTKGSQAAVQPQPVAPLPHFHLGTVTTTMTTTTTHDNNTGAPRPRSDLGCKTVLVPTVSEGRKRPTRGTQLLNMNVNSLRSKAVQYSKTQQNTVPTTTSLATIPTQHNKAFKMGRLTCKNRGWLPY
jgi:hypothetical protein